MKAKKGSLVGHLVTVACLAILSTILFQAGSQVSAGQDGPSKDLAAKRQQQEHILRGDLRAAAAVTGKLVQRVPVPGGHVGDLDSLVVKSSDIVVGRFGRGLGRYVLGSGYVTSDYDFVADEVLKGNTRPGEALVVVLMGGRAFFSDGSWAQTQLEKFRMPVPGERVLLFAMASPLDIPAVVSREARQRGDVPVGPTSYLSGFIRLDESGIIGPGLYQGIAKEFVGQQLETVLVSVRETVKRFSQTRRHGRE